MNKKISYEMIGILFAIGAYFSFAVLDTIQKTAVMHHSIFQLLFVKYFFCIILSIFESRRKENYNFFYTKNLKIQIFRCILSIIESSCFVLAFRYLSLANAHSIGSLAPVIVVALSAIFLQERVSLKTWIGIFFGFIGVLVIMRPGLSIFDYHSLIPLAGAFFLGVYQVVTKQNSKFDSSETMLFYKGLIGCSVVIVFAIINWQPLNTYSYLLIGVGVFFALGIYLQILALANARASIIQPYHYSIIFWAIVFGYIFYSDIPDLPTIIGALVIVTSGVYVLRKTI